MTRDRTSTDTTAERHRAIELAVQMRPEMEVADLQRVLARLGFDADEATLERDLDDLGYDIVDDGADSAPDPAAEAAVLAEAAGPRVDGAAPPPPDRSTDLDDTVDDADGRGGVDAEDARAVAALAAASLVTDADLDDEDHEPEPEPDPAVPGSRAPEDRPDRLTGVVGAVAIIAAIVCIASLVWLVASRDTGDAAADDGPDTTAEPRSSARSDPATTVAVDPTAVVPLSDPVEHMEFTETSGLLPATADGGRWVPLAGDFATADGVAVSDEGASSSVATIPTPPGDLRADVTLPEPSNRAGIAFAVQSDRSYRAWVVDVAASTAILFLVEGTGQIVEVEPVEVSIAPGVVLGISIEGDTTKLLVDGMVVATAPTRSGSGVGLAALAPLTASTFDDLRVAYG